MKERLKVIAEGIPYPVGRLLARVPMRIRLGKEYSSFVRESSREDSLEVLKNIQFARIRSLVEYAYECIPFYRHTYDQAGFLPTNLHAFDDIRSIPVVTKSDMRSWSLADRSNSGVSLKKSNTGGSSGQPLDFYLERSAYAREWAHMHAVWQRLGYRYTDEKLTVRGRNIGSAYYKYNFNQNEFLVNAYSPISENIAACRNMVKKNIKWIHGYPSAVVSFLRELECADRSLFEELIGKAKGVFLGSEYPAPQYRRFVEEYCGLPSISWYGHSEMAVLAPERQPGSGFYYPFHSYGFAEALQQNGTDRLIVTSTHNRATPFIRYDTGDSISPFYRDGVLEKFCIEGGRSSDNVIDLNGRAISLTGLIFGRHHSAFDRVDHVQVRQLEPGKIEILVVSSDKRNDWASFFDFSNSFFDVTYRQIDAPVTTSLGKVPLLLRLQ